MSDVNTLQFFNGLGIVFAAGFVVLTIAWVFLVLQLRDCAKESILIASEFLDSNDKCCFEQSFGNSSGLWRNLVYLKSRLSTLEDRISITAGAIPVLALLGTVIGFFFAIAATGNVGLGSSDPLKILKTMLDSGVSTALATTVVGQAIYFCLTLSHGMFVSGNLEQAEQMIEESLIMLRHFEIDAKPEIKEKTAPDTICNLDNDLKEEQIEMRKANEEFSLYKFVTKQNSEVILEPEKSMEEVEKKETCCNCKNVEKSSYYRQESSIVCLYDCGCIETSEIFSSDQVEESVRKYEKKHTTNEIKQSQPDDEQAGETTHVIKFNEGKNYGGFDDEKQKIQA